MGTQGFDVAVVGAGMGGLATACLLARNGRSVILLERGSGAGGVCQEVRQGGYRFALGPSLLPGRGSEGPLATLCQRLDIHPPFKESDPAFQVALSRHRISVWAEAEGWWREVRREFRADEGGWRTLFSEIDGIVADRDRALRELGAWPPEGWRDRLRVWRLGILGSGPLGQGKARGVLKQALRTSFRDSMVRHGLGQGSQRVLEAGLWYLLLRSADECSMLEAAVALRVRHGAMAVSGGMPVLVDALVRRFQQDGGELRLEVAVVRLLSERGRIVGLVTNGGETIRARWVVLNVPPEVGTGSLLPPARRWLRRRHVVDGPWRPALVAQVMVLAIPEVLLPSELSGHCFVVRDSERPAQEENVVFVRSAPAWDKGQAPPGVRCLTAGRFVAPRSGVDDATVERELLEALDQIIPGVARAMVFHQVLPPTFLEKLWGRPSAAVRYTVDAPNWLGQRGLPHRLGCPGVFAVGEWTYPGRLIPHVLEGAMRVADLIGREA